MRKLFIFIAVISLLTFAGCTASEETQREEAPIIEEESVDKATTNQNTSENDMPQPPPLPS